MREEMELHPWIETSREWLDYLDEIVVIARLLDYEVDYSKWQYSGRHIDGTGYNQNGWAWSMRIHREYNDYVMIVLNFVGGEFKRTHFHIDGKVITARKNKSIRKMKHRLRESL